MLRSLKELYGYKILALDGEVGKVHDFYFDDQEWEIRYLVVDTGPWILGRKVLISPGALGQPNWIDKQFPVNLKREGIEDSPDIDTDKPVSRQQQSTLHEYFNWPVYWATPFSTAPAPATYTAMQYAGEVVNEKEVEDMDPHLRKAHEVIGYQVDGRDGGLGKVNDFILDDQEWILRYLVLDAGELEKDKKVLIAPFWIQWIRFDERQVLIDLPQHVFKDSPGFDMTQPLNREYEEVLYDYHGRPYYWIKR
jgi:sporulation protein YlmC with PRC-barrel domain